MNVVQTPLEPQWGKDEEFDLEVLLEGFNWHVGDTVADLEQKLQAELSALDDVRPSISFFRPLIPSKRQICMRLLQMKPRLISL